jgi:hypothetical protein
MIDIRGERIARRGVVIIICICKGSAEGGDNILW